MPERRPGSNAPQPVIGKDCCAQICAHLSLTGTGVDSHCGEHERAAVHRERPQVGAEPEPGGAFRGLRRRRLPTVGHRHADGWVRRVMLTAPLGVARDAWADVVARLAGAPLLARARTAQRPCLRELPGTAIAACMVPSPSCRCQGTAAMLSPGHPAAAPAHGPALPLDGARRLGGPRHAGATRRPGAGGCGETAGTRRAIPPAAMPRRPTGRQCRSGGPGRTRLSGSSGRIVALKYARIYP